jgi:hypothetical protein
MMAPEGAEKRAENFLLRHSQFLMEEPTGVGYFDHWIAELKESDPEAFASLRSAIHTALNSADVAVKRSAIQALAVVGIQDDIPVVQALTNSPEATVAGDAAECLDTLRFRLMSWHERLESVVDRASFVRFVFALADERERAAEIERREPTRYMVDGALDWMNADIPEYLGACADLLESDRVGRDLDLDHPSWRLFAEFLYHGKIIE